MADDEKAQLGAGDVTITLQGEERRLKPSLDACITLSRSAGGITGAIQRCAQMDFDTIVAVISAGLAANPTQRKRLVEPAVFETGLINLADRCILFLRIVANGGKPPRGYATETAVEQLDLLRAYVGASETLAEHGEALDKLRDQLEAVLRDEAAEAEDLTDPLAETPSQSASITAA